MVLKPFNNVNQKHITDEHKCFATDIWKLINQSQRQANLFFILSSLDQLIKQK